MKEILKSQEMERKERGFDDSDSARRIWRR